MGAIDITSVVNAVERLREGLARHLREPDDEQVRDGAPGPVAGASGMTLAADHLAILRSCLRAHLPPRVEVFIFGSRATGTARRYSALDLALVAGQPVGLDVMAALADAFSESDLPFKVDLVDAALLDPAFRARIAANWVRL